LRKQCKETGVALFKHTELEKLLKLLEYKVNETQKETFQNRFKIVAKSLQEAKKALETI
jgi:hypothetical protein